MDTWGWNEGVIPHVFLGLKRECTLINDGSKDTSDEKKCISESELKKHSKTTQMELIDNLTQEYENNETNRVKWLKKTEDFDGSYLFFRQGYKDITIPAKQYFQNKTFKDYQTYKKSLAEFIQSNASNIDDIEGFFGFAPYKSALLRTSSLGDKERGGKVYQNNHYDNKRKNNNEQFATKHSGRDITNNDLPRYSFSKGHILTNIRPLSTFQSKHAFAMKIPTEKHREVVGKVLEDVLITDDDLRGGLAFVDDDSHFRFYALLGRSCVSFVKDKLKILFGNKLDWWDKMTWTPQGAYDVIKKHSKRFNAQELSITQSLLDIELFYQNYATLCSIDSGWECEKGLNAFILHYANLITLDNYIFPLTFNKEHAKALGDTKHIRENQIPFAFEKELLNIKQEYTNYQQDCSINRDTPLAFNDFKLQLNQDDLARRINTGTYIANELEYLKQKIYEDSKISLLTFHHKEERFHIANADNDFSYKDFDLSNIDSTASIAGYASSIKRASLIIADNIKYDGNITQESMRAYINVMVAKASGKFGNSHDTISLAKAYSTQQEKYNA